MALSYPLTREKSLSSLAVFLSNTTLLGYIGLRRKNKFLNMSPKTRIRLNIVLADGTFRKSRVPDRA
jgi:hypothetical protein